MNGSFTALAYHRVVAPGGKELSPALIDAYPVDFEAQMRYVAEHYNVISSWDLVRAFREGYTLPRRALIITFDDGYRCFRDVALPILQRLGLPVTLFVPTWYPQHPGAIFWWDAIYRALMHSKVAALELPGVGTFMLGSAANRSAAYERLVIAVERLREAEAADLVEQIVAASGVAPNCDPQMLLWDELADMAATGNVAIGPHTQRHIILAQAAPERVLAEVRGSWEDLQVHIAKPLPIFAYPNGKPHALSHTAVNAVHKTGLVCAFTMIAGMNTVGSSDPFTLSRIGQSAGESLQRFIFKLTPTARLYRRLKNAVKSEA